MRRALDKYYTPLALFQFILDEYDYYISQEPVVIDPCCGPNPCKQLGKEVISNDIDTSVEADTHSDATRDNLWEWLEEHYPGAWVITNPPFNVAFQIVKQAVDNGFRCAFLLRLSFLEPTSERGQWLANNPPTAIHIMPRVSFTNDGKTDSSTCAWMVWDQYSCRQKIAIVPRSTLLDRG